MTSIEIFSFQANYQSLSFTEVWCKIDVEMCAEGKKKSLNSYSIIFSSSNYLFDWKISFTFSFREELNRKMDCKRKEMAEMQRMLRQLEEGVHTLREEKLQLQSKMQQRETLMSKREDLNCQVWGLEREINVSFV